MIHVLLIPTLPDETLSEHERFLFTEILGQIKLGKKSMGSGVPVVGTNVCVCLCFKHMFLIYGYTDKDVDIFIYLHYCFCFCF